ncbi:hypothetical protein Hanom_Chr10g00910501 [Helianthus anomalus]
MKIVKFQTFWIQMQKTKPLDESRKTGQTLGTEMAFYSFFVLLNEIQKLNVQIQLSIPLCLVQRLHL